jgi:hypothetical protein
MTEDEAFGGKDIPWKSFLEKEKFPWNPIFAAELVSVGIACYISETVAWLNGGCDSDVLGTSRCQEDP